MAIERDEPIRNKTDKPVRLVHDLLPGRQIVLRPYDRTIIPVEVYRAVMRPLGNKIESIRTPKALARADREDAERLGKPLPEPIKEAPDAPKAEAETPTDPPKAEVVEPATGEKAATEPADTYEFRGELVTLVRTTAKMAYYKPASGGEEQRTTRDCWNEEAAKK